MNNTIGKTELLLNGDFTEEELKELEGVLKDKNVEVFKYFTKDFGAGEIVKILFRNFDAYQFLRDGILFEILMFISKKTLLWIKKKKPNAKVSGGIELIFKANKKEVPVNIGIPLDNGKSWAQVEKALTVKFVDSLKKGEITNIYWDVKEDKINITKM